MRIKIIPVVAQLLFLLLLVECRPNLFVPLFVRQSDGGLMPSMSFDLGFISDWIFPKSRDVLKIYKSGDEDRQDGEQDAEDGTVASRQEDLSGGISSWIMPPSRSAGPVPEGDNSLQDTSSNDQVLNAFIGLPEEIKTNLANASETLQNRFSNVSSDISSKLTKIHSKLADDVSNAIASQSKNETKTKLETPGFFDSFSMVSTFLDQVSANLFGIPSSSHNSSSTSRGGEVEGDPQTRAKREVVLSSFGEAGEIVNDVAKTVLNAVTIWRHQSKGEDCAQRLICESNKEIFARGYLVPSMLTYMSNIVLSSALIKEGKTSDLLMAARRGRKGRTDCIENYKKCHITL